jgi:hypothetical protein
MHRINIAVVGVGNCCISFVQSTDAEACRLAEAFIQETREENLTGRFLCPETQAMRGTGG